VEYDYDYGGGAAVEPEDEVQAALFGRGVPGMDGDAGAMGGDDARRADGAGTGRRRREEAAEKQQGAASTPPRGSGRRSGRRKGGDEGGAEAAQRALGATFDAGAGFSLPALDAMSGMPGASRSADRPPRYKAKARGGADDPLMPDSLTDGNGDWKSTLDEVGRKTYKGLGLALYNASSLDEMSAAMQGLQKFESEHKQAMLTPAAATPPGGANGRRGGGGSGGGGSGGGGEEDFRQQALAFYKQDSGVAGGGGFDAAQKAALAAQLERERKRASTKETRLIQTF